MNARNLLAGTVKNWPAKVLSIVLAIILFVFHRMSTLETRSFSAPLNIESNGPLMPSGSYTQTIRINLRGEANSIYPIPEDDVEVYVDIGKIKNPGTYTVPVQWRRKGAAQRVEPLQITADPADIILVLDQRDGKP